jgi:hypothetical protein
LRRTGGDAGSSPGRVDGYRVKITAAECTRFTIMLKTKTNAWLMRTNLLEKSSNGGALTASIADSFVDNRAFSFGDRDANR